ncbi:MAG: electron transfer flavoprotein subunit alpha/FixB family protein [Acholeplasmataceae bacterium]
MNNEIWIYAETHNNLVMPITYQLITKAKEITNNKKIVVILFEGLNDNLEDLIKEYGPDEIMIYKNDFIKKSGDRVIATLLSELVLLRKPNSFLFGATVLGRSISARLQAKLNTGLTADCLDLSFEDDLLIQTKPSYGDNIMCEIICPNHYPQMATVRPNIFVAKKDLNKIPLITKITNLKIKEDKNIKVYEEKPLLSKGDSISNANRVIAVGRGAYNQKNLPLIEELALKLGAKIGVTRPLTDLHPFSVDDQIGQSGNTISPRLLINLGVHGAVQFTSGILKSELIISINNNPKAPIFDYSDYSFIGDAHDFIKALLNIFQ